MNPNLGWRWTEYFVAIMGFLSFGLNVIFLEETYPPVVLVQKASELRRRTKNWGIHAKQEEIEVDFRELITKNFSRPLRLLVTEPIVLLLSIYMAFIYGLLYLFLTAYPIIFQEVHQMNQGVGGLPYFGVVFGMLCAGDTLSPRKAAITRSWLLTTACRFLNGVSRPLSLAVCPLPAGYSGSGGRGTGAISTGLSLRCQVF